MFHQSMSRHQRAKGSKVKNILQVTVLLAIVVWLLYQTKHSYERKPKYDESNYNKLSNGEMDIKLSRKVNAGSENVIVIGNHGNNSDEATEMEGTGVNHDALNQNSEEKTKNVRNDGEETQEDMTSRGKEETQQEQLGLVDDNGEFHTESEVNTDFMLEDLPLPNQGDGNNIDQNKNQNEVDNSLDKNGVSKDSGATDGSSTANNQAETGENAEQGSETGEHNHNDKPAKEESSSSPTSDDQSKKHISASTASAGTVETQESTGSDSKVEEATTNPRSNDANENVNLPSSEVDSQVASDSQAEIVGYSSMGVGNTDTSSNDGNANDPKSVEGNNVVMADTNGVPVGEEGESQTDRISEGQTSGNGSNEAVTMETSSEGENANLSGSSEEKGTVMSDVNGVPNGEEVQSLTGHISRGAKTDDKSSEEAKAKTTDKQSNAENSSEATEMEAVVSQGASASDAGIATDNTVEELEDPKPTDEAANSSQASENENVELPANGEDAVVGISKYQGHNVSGGENSGKKPPEEEKSEESGDLVANSAQSNERSNSDSTNNDTSNDAVASQDSALPVDNTSKNVEDATNETEFIGAKTANVGNNVELASGNGSAEGQEGSTKYKFRIIKLRF